MLTVPGVLTVFGNWHCSGGGSFAELKRIKVSNLNASILQTLGPILLLSKKKINKTLPLAPCASEPS